MLSTNVYNILLSRLLSGELQPGDIINRRQIAKECNVSVAPVMEAMMQLEHEGFLKTMDRKGTIVRYFTKEDIMGHLILKEAIECAAAFRYTREDIEEHYNELYQMAAELDRGTNMGSMQMWTLDLELHKSLVALAGYEELVNAFVRTAVPNLFCRINQMLANEGRQSHIQLLHDLMDDDRNQAVKKLQQHLWSGKNMESGLPGYEAGAIVESIALRRKTV